MRRRKFVKTGVGLSAISPFLAARFSSSDVISSSKSVLRTRVCDLLKIEYPVLQAGMSGVAGPDLVAAVSNAGGLGILTGTLVDPDRLQEQIARIKTQTSKPFGVNLILHQDLFPPADFDITDETVHSVHSVLNRFRRALGLETLNFKPPRLPELIAQGFEVILQEGVPVWSVGLGNPPRAMVDQCKDRGMKVVVMVSSLEDALTVAQSEPDIIVAQGSEAGGHRSTWVKKSSNEDASIGTHALLSQISSHVDIPVVAAGGIVNGAGILGALATGASGVMMGTRFIATKESMAPDFYKQKILEESSDHTTVTDVFTGMYARVIRNTFTEEYRNSGAQVFPPGRQFIATSDVVKAAHLLGRSDYYHLYAGQGIGQIGEVLTVQQLFENLLEEFDLAWEELWNKLGRE